mmetsp:Transcript_33141/g.93829  ORF Transcript_33141/g.93829 Transcript_33141/m.93829 type:complete len:209 (-) Transcript_33141:1738-2364(-)
MTCGSRAGSRAGAVRPSMDAAHSTLARPCGVNSAASSMACAQTAASSPSSLFRSLAQAQARLARSWASNCSGRAFSMALALLKAAGSGRPMLTYAHTMLHISCGFNSMLDGSSLLALPSFSSSCCCSVASSPLSSALPSKREATVSWIPGTGVWLTLAWAHTMFASSWGLNSPGRETTSLPTTSNTTLEGCRSTAKARHTIAMSCGEN